MIPVAVARAPAPYREGLASPLRAGGFDLTNPDDLDTWAGTSDEKAVLVLIQEEGDWSMLDELKQLSQVAVVALIPDHDIHSYLRALASGADGVVSANTSSELITHVLQAAVAGETVLPTEAARQLASLANSQQISPGTLTAEETALIHHLAEGMTIGEMARSRHLSERTVRRRLQSAYLKLGATNRSQAIARAARYGLTD